MPRIVKKISLSEVRRLRKQVSELQLNLNRLIGAHFISPGVHIASMAVSDVQRAQMVVAQELGYALTIRHFGGNIFHVHAIKSGEL